MKALNLTLLVWISAAVGGPTPNFPLVNQMGKPFQLHDLKGNYVFVSFIYTRCPLPKMCPLTMALSKALFLQAKQRLEKVPVHFLFVTLDPRNDTPSVLESFAKSHHLDNQKNISFATGSAQVLADLASEFNVIGVPADGTISHNIKSLLLGPDLKTIKEYKDNDWKPAAVIADVLASRSVTAP